MNMYGSKPIQSQKLHAILNQLRSYGPNYIYT